MLPPSLFTLVMEALRVSVESAHRSRLFHGIKLTNGGPSLTHSLYVAGALLMGYWSIINVKNLS